MRKLLSMLLLAVVGLPLVLPLSVLAADRERGVPACCRRGGKHHCQAAAAENGSAGDAGLKVGLAAERCPYCPGLAVSSRAPLHAALERRTSLAQPMRDLARMAEVRSGWLKTPGRSWPKRGPPAVVG